MTAREELYRGLNALRLEVDASIVESLMTLAEKALLEAHKREYLGVPEHVKQTILQLYQ